MLDESANTASQRQLGKSGLEVSPIALGTWPMSGVTTLDANEQDSLATLRACAELGVNFIDTAYCYGRNGESEQLIRRALAEKRSEFILATKCGIHFDARGEQAQDARPDTIQRECDESLARLGTDSIDLYYLHAPDPAVPVAESAGAIAELITAGKVQHAGISNAQLPTIQEFHAVCPIVAVQLPYNMLQRNIEELTVPWCRENQVAVVVYWALMKGLLAGKISRQAPLDARDKRLQYPMYQGQEWERNLAFVDELRSVADEAGKTVAQLVVNWTIQQPGITVALCGAKRRWQFDEVADAMTWQLTDDQQEQIAAAITRRGEAATKRIFR